MTKEVLLTISGLQSGLQTEGSDEIETVTVAEYYEKNGSHFVLYEEMEQGDTQPTKNFLKCSDHFLELTRRGLVNTRMIFREKEKNLTNYNTPFGQMVIGIDTKRIHLQEQENLLCMEVEYSMDINGEYLADCRVKITVRPRENSSPSQR